MDNQSPPSVAARNTDIYRQEMKSSSRQLVMVLQFLVGALVTGGGSAFTAFAVNDFGKALGAVHLSIGVIGLGAGFAILRAKTMPRGLVLAINGVTIAYSAFSESLVEILSLLPAGASIGSLVGTVIAIIMSCAIIWYLLTSKRVFMIA